MIEPGIFNWLKYMFSYYRWFAPLFILKSIVVKVVLWPIRIIMTLLQVAVAVVVMLVIKQILTKPQMAREMARQMGIQGEAIKQTLLVLQGKEQ